MLRFLVLGLVPGTSIQMQFWQILFVLIIVLCSVEAYVHFRLLPEYQEFKKLNRQKSELFKV